MWQISDTCERRTVPPRPTLRAWLSCPGDLPGDKRPDSRPRRQNRGYRAAARTQLVDARRQGFEVVAVFNARVFDDLLEAFSTETNRVHAQDRLVVKRGEFG